jgi:hypothetical protein
MNLTALGALGGAALTFLTFIIGLIGLRAKRKDRQVTDLVAVRDINVELMGWGYRVRTLAASEGWDQHPLWPPLPPKATADYLLGRADATNNPEMQQLGELVKGLADDLKGKTK